MLCGVSGIKVAGFLCEGGPLQPGGPFIIVRLVNLSKKTNSLSII